MNNYGIIEYHGSKQFLILDNTQLLIESEYFIPLDKVYLDSTKKYNIIASNIGVIDYLEDLQNEVIEKVRTR